MGFCEIKLKNKTQKNVVKICNVWMKFSVDKFQFDSTSLEAFGTTTTAMVIVTLNKSMKKRAKSWEQGSAKEKVY